MQKMLNSKTGNYRWRVIALLFFATTINYIDRQVLGILAPLLQELFEWSESDYSLIIMSFQAAYAIGLISMGGLLDKIGTKAGYIIAITIWSTAGMFHAAARSVISFALARFTLGIGESANFPAAVKTVAEWFPKRERAFATGIFNSGTNIGAILTPLIIPFIALKWGWQWAFISTGALGFIWLIFWALFYKRPEKSTRLKPDGKMCGNKLIMTVHKGGVKKYLDVAKQIAEKYNVPKYTQQRIILNEKAINSTFENDKVKKFTLDQFT